ncbi:ELKS/Rab6-interacting/CAST family member 1 isoform X5 [Astyanax mexicanus]|uniref:ELKS/Rab6-interacting/CAST family member 1 isoform X5 n=1 Tax=Astyanax mexicanus TaxID=7994 RepID=UPI0020CAF117|nr:ELKS/Rab6-interacting/CAST family member 1 isoform X5 [Astyanax mexicanus]
MYGSARSVGQAEASSSRSPHLPRSPRMGQRRVSAGSRGSKSGGGKTLSMENIQSLNAAYAASGPVYLSDHEALASSSYPKSTMTLGRATSRTAYGGRASAIGSSPNISSSLGHLHSDSMGYSDHGTMHLHSLQHQGPSSPLLRQAVRGVARGEGGPLMEQLRELQRENDLLRRELGVKDSKLGSSVNSIKSFWSPELKKERGMRKEELAKTSVLKEQMRVLDDENQFSDSERPQHLQITIQALQEELRTQRDLNQLLQQENRGGLSDAASDRFPVLELTEDNFHHLQTEHERQAKELFLLRKTLEEMELRIETQKQTLGSRDESIKKLLDMLQNKGLPRSGLPDEEGLRVRRETEEQLGHLEIILEQKENENMHLREELHRRNQQTDPAKTKALQTVIDLKIDQLKQELSKKESEMLALQTKLETLTNQNSDCKQHIEVLKESLTAKEQRANILQTEVDALRLRLEEKESFLNKKTKQLQDVTDEKGTLSGEIQDLKDMLDVKERKVTVLQKKIENLLEQLKDKDKQLGSLRDRVKSLQTDSSNTDTALATLEEALSEKERVIEHLKEQKEREEREKQEEMEAYKKENKELKDKIASFQSQLLDKESSLLELKEQVSSLASSGLQKDSRLRALESNVEQRAEECSRLESQLQKNPLQGKSAALEAEEAARRNPELSELLKALENEVAFHKEESGKSKAEVDRLLTILRDVESERMETDKKMSDMERQGKEQNKKLPGVKPTQLGEMRPSDAPPQLEELMAALEKTRQELDVTKQRLSTTQSSLSERENNLSSLRQERRKQMEEILEMKQQALLAAISEKDANIALLELSASKKKTSQEEVMALKREKDRLMYQLKQQTQSRMKLIAENYEDGHLHPHHPHHPHHGHPGYTHHRAPPRGPPPHTNHRAQLEQDDEEGIWA